MKSINTISEQAAANREQWFQYRRTLKNNLETLESIYTEGLRNRNTPAQTVSAFVEAVGYESAVEIVASMVNRSAWDGRISSTVKTWANSQENAWDEEAAQRLSIYTDRIHMAHLDQIAEAMMHYEPTEEPEAESQEVPSEPAEQSPENSHADKNGATIRTGDVVAISGGYFKNSNGFFLVTACPGDPTWSGRGIALHRIGKGGKLSERKDSVEFWPLTSYCSNREKAAEAKRWNAEQPAEQAPEKSIRFYWNGIKVDGGSLIRCFYSLDNNRDHSPAVSISCRDYSGSLPADLFAVRNDTDLMTDYFDTDRATLTPEHPFYKFARYAAECAEIRHLQNSTKRLAENIEKNPRFYARDDYYKNDLRQQQERLEHLKKHKNPGQPTAADLEAVAALNSAAKSARIAAEHAAQLAEREKMLAARNAGRVYIEQTAQQHPIQDGEPTVEIRWSEHPAFSSWEDGALILSVAAAEIILKHFDEQRAAENAANGCGGYDKTKFLIHYTDETGEAGTYEGRYDLGDNDGGLIAHIRSFAGTVTGEDARDILNVASMLEKFTSPGQETAETAQNSGEIVRVEVSPLLEQAAARVRARRREAEQETEEIMESLNLLTDEQLARAVLLTDPKNPDQANVGRLFLQKLDARDHNKAMQLYRYWQTGGAA